MTFRSNINLVVFDAGGVLHKSNRAVSADLRETLSLTEKETDMIWCTLIPLLGSGKIDEPEFWRRVEDMYKTRSVSVEENLLGRRFAETLEANAEVFKLVEQLKQNGRTVVVMSDTIEPHARVLHERGLYEPFGKLFLSYETGYRKPDLMAYRHVLETMGVPAHQAVFIDDDGENIGCVQKIHSHGITYTTPAELRRSLHQLALI